MIELPVAVEDGRSLAKIVINDDVPVADASACRKRMSMANHTLTNLSNVLVHNEAILRQ